MIRIEQDGEGEFFVLDGYNEFIEQMEKQGMAKVVDAASGRNYYAHEVGEHIHLLNEKAHYAMIRLADILIQEIAVKSLR